MKAKTDSDREIVERAIATAQADEGVRTGTGLWRSFATPEHDLRSRAEELSVPTLIVWGKKDVAIPLSAGRATHASIRGSRLEILDTGHVAFSSDPDGFLAVAEPFLQSGMVVPMEFFEGAPINAVLPDIMDALAVSYTHLTLPTIYSV